jgi:hypothetical protein
VRPKKGMFLFAGAQSESPDALGHFHQTYWHDGTKMRAGGPWRGPMRLPGRLASDTVFPEYFAFQATNVPSEMPCLRQRSAHFAPASCFCRIPMICSSVHIVRFIVRPFLRADSRRKWGKIPWQVTPGTEERCKDGQALPAVLRGHRRFQ